MSVLLGIWAALLAMSLPLFGHAASGRARELRPVIKMKKPYDEGQFDRRLKRLLTRFNPRIMKEITESRLSHLSLILLSLFCVGLFNFKVALCIAVVLVVAVPLRNAATRRRRLTLIQRQAPMAVDLFRIAIDSGMNVSLAMQAVAKRMPAPLGAELDVAVTRIAYGERVADALNDLASRTSESLRPLTDALVSSERYGSPLSTVLERVAFEYRLTQERLADRNAKRLSLQVIIPLTCFTFPACVLLIATPLFASSFGSLAAFFS